MSAQFQADAYAPKLMLLHIIKNGIILNGVATSDRQIS